MLEVVVRSISAFLISRPGVIANKLGHDQLPNALDPHPGSHDRKQQNRDQNEIGQARILMFAHEVSTISEIEDAGYGDR